MEQPDPVMAIEPEPTQAAAILGDSIERGRKYVQLLADDGVERGIIGPREAARLWTRHVLNCAVVAELIPDASRVVDIGSGAGLPGIALALAHSSARIDLVESLLRRCTFLSEVVESLSLADRCRVVRSRAEEATGAVGGSDIVTARAVAPLHKLGRWAAPLLRDGGTLLAMKGASAADEVARDGAALRRCGLTSIEILTVGDGVLDPPTTVVRATRAANAGAGT